MRALARGRYLELVPRGPPGACSSLRALYGLYFFTLSCQGMCGHHTEAPNPRLQSQHSGKSTGSQNKIFAFQLSREEDFSDFGDQDEPMTHLEEQL